MLNDHAGNHELVHLLAEAPYLMKDEIAKAVLPVGFKPLVDLMQQCREAGVPIYV